MIRPFKAEDMMALLADGIMECGITTTGNEALETLSHEREANGRGYSYFIDGHIAGCAGLELLWPGVGDLWLMLGSNAKEKPITTVRNVRKYLHVFIEENGLWRVQTTGRVDFPEANRLIEMLGFKRHTDVLEKYGPDKSDYYLYSMVI